MKQYFKNFAIAAVLILAAVFACGGSDTESVRVVQTVVVEKVVERSRSPKLKRWSKP